MRATLLVVVMAVICFACGSSLPEEDVGTSSEALSRSVLPNRLVEDSAIEGHQDVTAAQVQAFLQKKGSKLASYKEGKLTAAEMIVNRSKAEKISPIYMLARIETESGLVSSGTFANLLSATGCGCPDGEICDPTIAEFGLQVRCAAELMRWYLDALDTKGFTVSGWRVGVGKSTLDGCWIVPQTRATAAFYTYTPWVGAYGIGCGTSQWGGSSLVAALLKQYIAEFPAAAPTNGGATCELGDGLYCSADGKNVEQCTGGKRTLAEACANGCEVMPPGVNDRCKPPPPACQYGDGLYCGGNGTPGDPNTLYRCTSGKSSVVRVCASGCQKMAANVDDRCK
jgi:hypothetical protein